MLNARALIGRSGLGQAYRLQRVPVSEALAPWLDFHWLIDWDLPPGVVHRQQVLPYPNCHLVFEQGATALHGVSRGVYLRELRGRGRVHGLRFKCGGLRAWLGQALPDFRLSPAAQAPAGLCLGADVDLAEAERQLLQAGEPEPACAAAEALLLARRPVHADGLVARLDSAVQRLFSAEGASSSLAELQAQLGFSERALQRCCADYLGVSPKWLLQRARLQQALQALGSEPQTPLAELAQRLGFFDQAHFSRSLRQTFGQSASQLRALLASA